MEVRAADFVGYTVSDLDRSNTFYRDILGLKPVSYTHLTLPTN